MKLYFAPLEGITTYTYRNLHKEMFGGCDGYYSPFITPSDKERIVLKNLRDILPERNRDINLTVQVLTAQADSFLRFAEKVRELSYNHININLGCPSGTVVKKGRGSGFLKDVDGIDRFLDGIFSHTDMKVSVKTRSGFFSGDELPSLMKVYNRYPLELLIVHPRARADFYNGEPDERVFEEAYSLSKNKICYNGNIFSAADYKRIENKYPKLDRVMLGRGAVANPALFREINGGEQVTRSELTEFSMKLADMYTETLGTELYALHKLKEIWIYVMRNYPDEKKILKGIKKSEKLSDFKRVINSFV